MTPAALRRLAADVREVCPVEIGSRVYSALMFSAAAADAGPPPMQTTSELLRGVVSRPRVLVVEDNPWDMRAALRIAEHYGWTTATLASADNYPDALDLVSSFRPHVIVADNNLGDPVLTGTALVRDAKAQRPRTTGYVFTSSVDVRVAEHAAAVGAVVLFKSSDMGRQWDILRALFTVISAGGIYGSE